VHYKSVGIHLRERTISQIRAPNLHPPRRLTT